MEDSKTTKIKKKWYKKWWIWLIVVVVIVMAGSSSSTNPVAEVTYQQESINKGDATGYTKTLGNGDFVVGEDIEPGMYNISGLGWADLITATNPMDMINASEDGTVSNLTLEEGQKLSILDQSNAGGSAISGSSVTKEEDILFTQIQPKTLEGGDVSEKIEYIDNKKVCFIDNEEAKCDELQKYDELNKEIDSQISES